jgi:hypothetical protein
VTNERSHDILPLLETKHSLSSYVRLRIRLCEADYTPIFYPSGSDATPQ